MGKEGSGNLVLTRKTGQRILVGENIWITVVETMPGKVKIGIDAPLNLRVRKGETPSEPTRDAG